MAKGRKTGGRAAGTPNKATADVRAYAGKFCTEAIDGLVKVGRTSESDQARVAAWNSILDRYAGKPSQALTDADGGNLPTVPQIVHFILRQQEDATNRT